ncbi:MAG: phosphoenolpyruvate carboxykinase [Paraprevotella sp.]|nr:phosphoenolpyruvate carboxykinase [Paraprevotella sp.]
MTDEYFFSVAGLLFSVTLPCGWDAVTLLPSFRPFLCGSRPEGKQIFRLAAVTLPFSNDGKRHEPLDESSNDMGHVRLLRSTGGYRIEMDYGNTVHTMTVDSRFSRATAFLLPSDPSLGMVLSSMLRILYAQAVLVHGGISIHASCVCLEGRGYLFLGKSGTGKSTHARQWMATFPGCSLLNDDNPVLRIQDNTLTAHGTPWSGKTPCYKNESLPVAGIARLRQSADNRFLPLDGPEAFAALLPSCSAVRQDTRLQDALHETLIRATDLAPIGLMECRPDAEAARRCLEGLAT